MNAAADDSDLYFSGWYVHLSHERVLWPSADAMPEVAPSLMTMLFNSPGEDEAARFGERWAHAHGLAVIPDADIRPIETCGACGEDFDTSAPHLAVILQEEEGPPEDLRVGSYRYLTRVCPRCKPKVDLRDAEKHEDPPPHGESQPVFHLVISGNSCSVDAEALLRRMTLLPSNEATLPGNGGA
jgi:hypothetical protein